MEKFKTLNNGRCKDIILSAIRGNYRSVYMQIYNSYDLFTDELFSRLMALVWEISPLTLDVCKTLPLSVQNFYNQLWLQKKLF